MATAYGPINGYYSRDSIMKARQTDGKEGTRILDVGKDGKAPSNARVGDYIRTAGGTYQITGGSAGNWQSAKQGTAGYGSISDTPSGSKNNYLQSSMDYAGGFDTQAIYDRQLQAKYALLQQQYNTDLNNLQKAYDTNVLSANNQSENVKQAYLNQVADLKQQTYNELQRSKELGVQRGITNSALGRAQDQTMLRAGNSSVNDATTERNRVLNEITNKINSLTQAYGNDKSTLSSNLGQAKLQAMSEAELQKLNTDLDLYKQNIDWANQFKMNDINFANQKELTNMGYAHDIDMNKLTFGQQKELQALDAEAQARLARIAQSGSRSDFNLALQQETARNNVAIFTQQMSPLMTTMPKSDQAKVYSLLNQMSNGQISYQDAINQMSKYTTYNGSNVADFKQYK